MIYIREAHPNDGWQVEANLKDGWIINEPKTWEERKQAALNFINTVKLSIPVIIDNMDNKTDSDYKAWPDRAYIVGKDGKIIYKGGPGPGQFKPMEIVGVLEKPSRVDHKSNLASTWGSIKRI